MPELSFIHECEHFNNKNDKGEFVPNTFNQERYDRNFPHETPNKQGVPVGPNEKECPFCYESTDKMERVTKEQQKYLEGEA